MSLLNNAVNAPAWTTVLIDDGPAAGARRWARGYAPPRYLKSWDQLMMLEQFPKGSVLYEWDGRQWQRPPYLAQRVSGWPFKRYEVDLDTPPAPGAPYAGFREVFDTNVRDLAKAVGWALARGIPEATTQIWDWGAPGPRVPGARPALVAAYTH